MSEWICNKCGRGGAEHADASNPSYHCVYSPVLIDEPNSTHEELRAAVTRLTAELDATIVRETTLLHDHRELEGMLKARIERLEGALREIASTTCSCHANDDPNWHSSRCNSNKARAALSTEGRHD